MIVLERLIEDKMKDANKMTKDKMIEDRMTENKTRDVKMTVIETVIVKESLKGTPLIAKEIAREID